MFEPLKRPNIIPDLIGQRVRVISEQYNGFITAEYGEDYTYPNTGTLKVEYGNLIILYDGERRVWTDFAPGKVEFLDPAVQHRWLMHDYLTDFAGE